MRAQYMHERRCGYRHEAASQRRFGELLRAAPEELRGAFHVPEVVEELSSERVLCSDWVRVRVLPTWLPG